jgi:DNA polymerase-1
MENIRLLIVDGSNLLFQMFYGMPARILGKNGKPIQGVLGFVGALGKMIQMVKPSHMAVLFDGECHNERKDLDPCYKANRPDYSQIPEEDTPFSQLPDIFRALQVMGIPFRETDCCEADDWIAGYARRYGDSIEVVIASQDSDFFQLISENVRILRYRGQHSLLCDRDYIQEKFGILPEQYADFKAMVGDSADNIRGADKIGPKTAAALLQQFGTLEQILHHTEQVQKPSIRTSLQENTQRLMCNQKLIHLSGAAVLPFDLDALSYRQRGRTTTQILKEIDLL